MMPVCVTSLFWPMLAHIYVVRTHASSSNRMLTAADVTTTGVIVNKHFLIVTYWTFNQTPDLS